MVVAAGMVFNWGLRFGVNERFLMRYPLCLKVNGYWGNGITLLNFVEGGVAWTHADLQRRVGRPSLNYNEIGL